MKHVFPFWQEDSDDLYMGANMSVSEQITPFTPIISARNVFIMYNTDSLTAAASYYCNYE